MKIISRRFDNNKLLNMKLQICTSSPRLTQICIKAKTHKSFRHDNSSHLLSDNDQRVPVLRQEVEDAPDLEGIIVVDEQLTHSQVLPGAQQPAHPVEVLPVEVFRHLRQRSTTVVSRGFVVKPQSLPMQKRKTAFPVIKCFHPEVLLPVLQ